MLKYLTQIKNRLKETLKINKTESKGKRSYHMVVGSEIIDVVENTDEPTVPTEPTVYRPNRPNPFE